MPDFHPLTPALLVQLEAIVGPAHVATAQRVPAEEYAYEKTVKPIS